ncbi:hypothetical protein V6N13_041127 [Hibiscus sabdariffa]
MKYKTIPTSSARANNNKQEKKKTFCGHCLIKAKSLLFYDRNRSTRLLTDLDTMKFSICSNTEAAPGNKFLDGFRIVHLEIQAT